MPTPRIERALEQNRVNNPNRAIAQHTARAEAYANLAATERMIARASGRTTAQAQHTPAGSLIIVAHSSAANEWKNWLRHYQSQDGGPQHFELCGQHNTEIVILPIRAELSEINQAWQDHVRRLGRYGYLYREGRLVLSHEWVDQRVLNKMDNLASGLNQLLHLTEDTTIAAAIKKERT